MSTVKRVYTFGNKQAEGNGKMRELLGGKGANLAEMNLVGIPVPPGFTITTEVCTEYYEKGRDAVVEMIRPEVEKAIKGIEKQTGMTFGSDTMPLLVSVRSGARASMPGMMDTILNLGLNDTAVKALAKRTGNDRFAWDSYRRFVQMYGDVVLGMKPQSKEDEDPFEVIIDEMKKERGVRLDTELSTDDLRELVVKFKAAVKERTGADFPTNPWEQLWGASWPVFQSWMNERAILYRKLNNIPAEWGTAVNVQAMVFGNMGDRSATGVAFTRDAATGENIFNGEYLINAQGEDVVAGIRTPQQITLEGSRRWAAAQGVSEEERKAKYPSLEEAMPAAYKELFDIQEHLERYFTDMQDLEFTIQDGKLWMLQTRNGKRTGAAMLKIAMDMLAEAHRRKDGRTPMRTGQTGRTAPSRIRRHGDEKCQGTHQGSSRLARRSDRRSGLFRRGRRQVEPRRPESHPRAHRNLARRPQRHECGGGYPDGPRRHDLARGRSGPRHGQMLRIGSRRAHHRL